MTYRYILFLILGIDALLLSVQISELSISYYEASLLYDKNSFLHFFITTSINLFGQNDFSLRTPMLVLHILSALLLYKISQKYIDNEKNRLWLLLVFVMLPGVISSAIVVSSAGLIIFALLLLIYVYQNHSRKILYILLFIYSIIDSGFIYLFISLVLYGLYRRDKIFYIFNISLLFINIFIYGVHVFGTPKGHFLDSIGIYSAIFTPIIFIYLFYVLYRRYLTKDIDIVWFISSVTLVLSLLLSFRQRIDIEHFAPYLIVALPLAAQTFYSSYRVRLKIFRSKYKIIFTLSMIFLFLNSLLVFFHKEIYLLIDNPKKHFAYKMHVVKELAKELDSRGIDCVKSSYKISKRLKFYNIGECEKNLLNEYKYSDSRAANVTIRYKNKAIYYANVTKLNNK